MTSGSRLPARAFYGVVAAGVLLGAALALLAGWLYLENGGEPAGRSLWADAAGWFVVPICVMIGSTFGGLAGVAAAVVWDRRRSRAG